MWVYLTYLQGIRDLVEAGRVAYINFGEDYGKMVVIVDLINDSTVFVDGLEHFPRVSYPLRRLSLTRLRLPILRGARTGTVKKAAKSFDLTGKWEATPVFKKMARFNTRRGLTDIDRFRVMIARKTRSYQARTLFAKKAAAKK